MTARVVSLVPSVTETLLAMGVEPVACTRFCEQPALRHVGGTKDPDISAIVALQPDVVVVDDEENRREDADALAAAGLRLHVTSVHAVDDVAPTLAALAQATGAQAPNWVTDRRRSATIRQPERVLRAFVPIWRRPWMALGGDTYGSSVLEAIGVVNVCAGDQWGRYPSVDLDAATALKPDLVLAPSEPYPFADRHAAELEQVAPVVLVDGKDLFWWGVRTPGALTRLATALSRIG